MPLDADTQAVLQQFEQLGMPALGDLPPEQARAVFNEAFKTPEEAKAPVAHVEDRTIPGPAGEIPVRIFQAGPIGPLPGREGTNAGSGPLHGGEMVGRRDAAVRERVGGGLGGGARAPPRARGS